MLRTLFPGHARWAKDVDAFVDGELHGSALARFVAHRASCNRCQASIEDTRALKSAFASVQAPASTRSFQITAAMVAPREPVRLAARHPSPLLFRGAMASTVLAAGAFVVSVLVGVAQDNESFGGRTSLASLELDSALAPAAAGQISEMSNRSAAATESVGSPKFASTVTPIVVATPTMPSVAGVSSGNGTGELPQPGASPRPPATGAQPVVPNPSPEQPLGGSADRSAPLPTQLTASKDAFDQAYDVRPEQRSKPLRTASDNDKGLRAIQISSAVVTVIALAIVAFALRRRGKVSIR